MRDSKPSIVKVIASRPARALTCAALAVAFAATPLLSPVAAYAVSSETQAELDAAESQVDSYAAAYNEAAKKLEELQAKIDEYRGMQEKALEGAGAHAGAKALARKCQEMIDGLEVDMATIDELQEIHDRE